ncbi:MAG: hypothetical protein P8179_21725 [Candidatus Thiodiazotropha sp.]
MTGLVRFLTSFFLMFVLAACGGGDAETPWDSTGTGGSGGESTVTLGHGVGNSFVSGVLAVSADSIYSNGSTTVNVSAADTDGNLYKKDLTITFSSTCSETGLATITPSVSTSSGLASATYTANGCAGSDSIVAIAVIDGVTSTASVDIEITSIISLGSGSGPDFSPGVLDVAVASLSAGGQTSVRATLADANGNLYQGDATVSFSSDCQATGAASIDEEVESSTGVFIATYLATGCSGKDEIHAFTTVAGVTSTATGAIEVQPAEIGSLEFVSAEPALIGIRGVGLPEVSTVTFQVLDSNGNPVPRADVLFSLNTRIGGVSITDGSDSSTSDARGYVSTDVNSGTVPTVVRVTASLADNPLVVSQSDGLVISTGISDQDSFSLSLSDFNPEAWGYDGVEVDVTVHAADHFNNPVPDGTAVYFTTEGGQIQSQCQIVDGACTVAWRSSNPRPANGRVTLLATMLGEESFVDLNGNGVLDFGDTADADIPEAFRDDDEDGSRDAGSEEFVDFNANGRFDDVGSDPDYNGALCCDAVRVAEAESAVGAGEDPGVCYGVTPTVTPACSQEKNINVRRSSVMIMAESFARITPISGVNSGTIDLTTGGVSVEFEIVGSVTGQVMPAGTTIEFSSTNGDVGSDGSYLIPSTTYNTASGDRFGLNRFTVGLSPTENQEDGDDWGTLTVTVTTPRGNETKAHYVVID